MGTRSYFLLVAVIAASMMVAVGCRSRRGGGGGGGGGTDSGTPMTDGGGGGTDSGPVGTDSGPVGTDSGPTPECFTTGDCPSGEECIEGMCEPMTMSCPTNSVPAVSEMLCSETTQTCVEGCADGTCILDCLEADTNPDCMACVNQNIISCWNSNGCQEEWNCFNACIEENCPSDGACADTTCSTENDAYSACGETVPESAMCGTVWTPCVGL